MLRALVLATIVVVALAAGALALAGAGAPVFGAAADDAGPFPTATPTATPGAGDGGGDATTPTPVEEPFAATIDAVEDCGTTCRDVTVSLTNRQREPAADVTVYTQMFAGNSTAEDDLVWSGEESVGALESAETHTSTRRVELTYGDALDVQDADGWVTVRTTVQSADRTVTFTEQRNAG